MPPVTLFKRVTGGSEASVRLSKSVTGGAKLVSTAEVAATRVASDLGQHRAFAGDEESGAEAAFVDLHEAVAPESGHRDHLVQERVAGSRGVVRRLDFAYCVCAA